MVDVCLVQMPYCAVERPSIALGLLKSYLAAANISARVIYANLAFADAVGLDVYKAIEDTPAESLIGEWTFARAAFPGVLPDEETFLDRVEKRLAHYPWFTRLRLFHPAVDCRAVVAAVRERTTTFVDRIARQVLSLGPRIVGCTSMFQQHCGSLALLRRIKELAPDTVTMMGGANCEGSMGEVTHREFTWVDFVASGEVDGFFGELCRDILEQGTDLEPRQLPAAVFGPGSRARRRLCGAPPRAALSSMDGVAAPDYDEYFEFLSGTSFGGHLKPSLPFESSRGCWWGMKHHCTFCGLNGEGMVFRSKSVVRVCEELAALRSRYGIRWMQAVDNIMDNGHLQKLLPELAALPDPYLLFYEVKANLKKEQLRLLGAAGVRRIQPGIESLHDDVLKLLDKGNNCFMNLQLLKWAQEFGIRVSWNFLSGAPGESEDWYREINEWLPLIYHLEPPGADGLSEIRYDRFSVYFKDPERHGLRLVPNRAYAHVYPLSPSALRELAYFFEDAAHPGARGVGPMYDELGKGIERWRRAFLGSDGAAPARLLAQDEGDRVLVHDTRPGAPAEPIVLEGLEYRIWKACDAACSVASLDALAPDAPDQISAALQRLKDRRLVLHWRGRVMNLTVSDPVVPYLKGDELPGYRELPRLLKTLARTSLARDCLRLPQETPLADLCQGPVAGGAEP